jgi:predicted nucleotidyltransferase
MSIDIFKELMDRGAILVGSRAWGGAEQASDWDYILLADKKPEMDALLAANNLEIKKKEYGGPKSEYISFGDSEINLIYLSKSILRVWKQANEMMHHFPKEHISNRKLRRFVFTMLVDTLFHWGDYAQ